MRGTDRVPHLSQYTHLANVRSHHPQSANPHGPIVEEDVGVFVPVDRSLPPLSVPLKLPPEGEAVADELQPGAASVGPGKPQGRQREEKYFENKHRDCLHSEF